MQIGWSQISPQRAQRWRTDVYRELTLHTRTHGARTNEVRMNEVNKLTSFLKRWMSCTKKTCKHTHRCSVAARSTTGTAFFLAYFLSFSHSVPLSLSLCLPLSLSLSPHLPSARDKMAGWRAAHSIACSHTHMHLHSLRQIVTGRPQHVRRESAPAGLDQTGRRSPFSCTHSSL